ncbi:MAG: long-chain fatty acid--CoA ligase, partial [Epsilonproteobacteria bacterium]|nr:long-chain fatty acid--CoA ligase [Campylobacterota bacterium]
MNYKFNNFYEIIEFQAKKRKKKPALLLNDDKISYGDIKEAADKLAAFLSKQG